MIISYMDILGSYMARFINGNLDDVGFDKMRVLSMWRDNDRRRQTTINAECELIESLNNVHNSVEVVNN